MKKILTGAALFAFLTCGVAEASIVGFAYTGALATGNDNLLLYTNNAGFGSDPSAVVSVAFDPSQLTGCSNGAAFSYCNAPLGVGSVWASFTTTDKNSNLDTFTETGGAPALSPVSCPEGYCTNTGGGIHIFDSNGFASAQFYAFGPDGHYLAGGWSTDLAWQSNALATDQTYESQMLSHIVGITWFYSGQFTTTSGPNCDGPNQGPYCQGFANFAPGDYFGNVGNLSPTEFVGPGTPEPATWSSLATGILGVGFLAARRRRARA